MANSHMKKCSISPVTREMQIKTTIRYHLTPVRVSIIKKSANNKHWQESGETGTFVYCWWECKLVQPLGKIVREFLKKKIELLYDPAISFLGIYLKKMKTLNLKRYMLPSVHSSTVYSSQDTEAT